MREPRTRDNGASDVWALTAYTNELFVKRLENYLIIIKRYINRNYSHYYYFP